MIQKTSPDNWLKLALPKGRMETGVHTLLRDAGISITPTVRGYRPEISLKNTQVKTMKPQNIIEMLALGRRDLGFAGADWVSELDVEVVELLDTGLDKVRVVAAAPEFLLDESGHYPDRQIIIASEYQRLTRNWIAHKGIHGDFVRSYGATEVFPPEDADMVVDNTSTGSTLRANDLVIVDTLMESSTRLYASPEAMNDPSLRSRIENFTLLLKSVLEARQRVMIEVNSPVDRLDGIVKLIPCMREVTVSPLFGNKGYAIKAAVPRSELALLIPQIKDSGGTDIVVSNIAQIVS
jgi:ATP phosphoribosyltransferase